MSLPLQSAEVEGSLLLSIEFFINFHARTDTNINRKAALILVRNHNCLVLFASFEKLSAHTIRLFLRLIGATENIIIVSLNLRDSLILVVVHVIKRVQSNLRVLVRDNVFFQLGRSITLILLAICELGLRLLLVVSNNPIDLIT